MNRVGRVVVTVGVLVLGACTSRDEDGQASARQCEQHRDHLVDLRLADASGVDRDAHRKIMKRALNENFAISCTSLSGAQIKCALDAKTLSDAASCNTVL
jgi:hypothetical protein